MHHRLFTQRKVCLASRMNERQQQCHFNLSPHYVFYNQVMILSHNFSQSFAKPYHIYDKLALDLRSKSENMYE